MNDNWYTINLVSYYFNLGLTWVTNYVTYIYDHFMEFSWTIKVAAISLTASFLLVFYTLVKIFFRSMKRRRWERVSKKLEKKYGDTIKFVLSEESNPDMKRRDIMEMLDLSPKERKKGVHLKNFKENLSFSRLVYKAIISSEASLVRTRNLHELMHLFELQSFLEKLVNKGKMRYKAEALLILRASKLQVNPWIVNQLANSPRYRVRRLAMYASIMTGSNNDLEYFESEFFDNNSCIYDEIELGYVLKRRQAMKRKIPNLASWALMHKNPSTQAMLIRQMRYFNQKEFCADLEEIFHRDSHKDLIQEICRTWGYLRYTESEELMQEILISQPDDTKITILHALARMNTGKSLNTLVDGFLNNGDENVKYEALRCLYAYGPAGQSKLRELSAKTTDPRIKRLFEFFSNPLTAGNISLVKTDAYEQVYGDNLFSVV